MNIGSPATAGMLAFACAACASTATIGDAAAQGTASATYPTRTIRWVAPFTPGGATDIVARIVAERLADPLGQQVVVDNRPGAGGNIAAELVVKAPPDGYTLLVAFPGLAINPSLYGKLGYDPIKDLAPVVLISSTPLILVVNPSLPAKTVKEFITLAKRRPGEMLFPSAGNGTSGHLGGELFRSAAGIDAQHVPYKGSIQGITDLIGGRAHFMVTPLPEMIQFIQTGKLRGIAVTSVQRSAVLPSLPTVGETLPGFDVTTWNGMMAPAGTPKDIIARLNGEVVKVLKLPATVNRMKELGLDIIASSPEELASHLRRETDKWAKVVKAAGARIE